MADLTESLLIQSVMGIEIKAEISGVFVLNIPLHYYDRNTLYSNFLSVNGHHKQDSWIVKTLFLFASFVQSKFIGSNRRSEDPTQQFIQMNGVPIFAPVFETLFSEIEIKDNKAQPEPDFGNMEEDERPPAPSRIVKIPVGVRLWLFCFDKDVNLGDSLITVINNNHLCKAEHKIPKGAPSYEKFIHYVDNAEIYINEVCDQYTQLQTLHDYKIFEKNFDATHDYQPEKIFSVHNAFRVRCNDVCKQQRTLSSYFSQTRFIDNNFVDLRSWKGFPFANDVYYVPSPFFKPKYLYDFPVPWVIAKIIKPPIEKIVDPLSSIDALAFNENGLLDYHNMLEPMGTVITPKIATDLKYLINLVSMAKMGKFKKDEDRFAEVNDIFKTRVNNRNLFNKWLIEKPLDAPNLMKTFAETQCGHFFNLIMTSDNLTPAVIAARDFLADWTSNGYPLFFRIHNIWKNLSHYGAFRVFEQFSFDKVHRAYTNFDVLKVLYLSAAAGNYSPLDEDTAGLKPNTLIVGPATTGKSWALQLISDFFPSGVGRDCGNYSDQAHLTNGDFSDGWVYFHEFSPDALGIGNDGNIPQNKQGTDRQAEFKDRLGKGISRRAVCEIVDGERVMNQVITRHDNTTIGAYNFIAPSHGNPIFERFITLDATFRQRADKSKAETNSSFGESELKKEADFYKNKFRIISVLHILTEKFLETGILRPKKDVNMEIFDIVWQRLISILEGYGLPIPSDRKRLQIRQLARAQTIQYAIMLRMLSSLNKGFTMDGDAEGRSRTFVPEMLFGLEPFLVCTEEIALDVLSLLSQTWLPAASSKLADILVNKVGKQNYPFNNLSTYLQTFDLSTNSTITDKRYIAVAFNSMDEALHKIKGAASSEMTLELIKGTIQTLLSQTIPSKDYDLKPIATDNSARNHSQQQNTPPIALQTATSNLKGDIQPPAFADAAKTTPQTSPQIVVSHELKEDPSPHAVEKNIPILKQIYPNEHMRKQVIFAIAIKYFEISLKLTPEGILQEVFEYQGQQERDFFCSLPYKTDKDIPLWQICRTLHIRNTTDQQIILNPSIRTTIEMDIAKAFYSETPIEINEELFKSNFMFDDGQSLDFNIFTKDLHEFYGSLEETYFPEPFIRDAVVPGNFATILAQLKNPRDTQKFNYPQDLVKEFKKQYTARFGSNLKDTTQSISKLWATKLNPKLTPSRGYTNTNPTPVVSNNPIKRKADNIFEVIVIDDEEIEKPLLPKRARTEALSHENEGAPCSPVQEDPMDQDAGLSTGFKSFQIKEEDHPED